jgi:hypothetical protein
MATMPIPIASAESKTIRMRTPWTKESGFFFTFPSEKFGRGRITGLR